VSHHILGAGRVLSCVVLQYNLGRDGHLHKNDEDDYVLEDSDYEDEAESTNNQNPGGTGVDCGNERGQELTPVLCVGSPAA